MCGEKAFFLGFRCRPPGSPPRVRGKVGVAVSLGWAVRITPACAGKSHSRRSASSSNRDHPRVCGEKAAGCGVLLAVPGSPPRVRGKVSSFCFRNWHIRITPACAGKRERVYVCTGVGWDHPRVCGEKQCSHSKRAGTGGSPPRVRGKAICHCKIPF